MKIMIEVQGGLITNITATEPVSIYIIDHDALKEDADEESIRDAGQASQPDFVCDEECLETIVKSIVDEYMAELQGEST